MKEEIYDHIFIGSGPISILEALSRKTHGESVLLIDKANSIGGAWGTTELPNGENVEIGCHIWSISKPVFKFIKSYLQVDMMPLKPQPYIYRNGKKFLYDWKSNVITARKMLRNIKKGHLKNLITDWKLPAYRLVFFPSKYMYPEKGATSFAAALESKVQENEIDVLLNEQVTEMLDKESHIELVLGSGVSVKARKTSITSVSSIDKYKSGDNVFSPETDEVQYIHVHFELSDNHGKKISYVRWLGAASNLERLMIVGVYQNAYHKKSETELVQDIVKKLKSNGFIGEGTEVKNWQFNIFPTFYIRRTEFDPIIDAFNGKLNVLSSTDLIYAMHSRLGDWENSLLSNRK